MTPSVPLRSSRRSRRKKPTVKKIAKKVGGRANRHLKAVMCHTILAKMSQEKVDVDSPLIYDRES